MLIIAYSILAIIGIVIITICIFTKNIPLQRIAMLYIAVIMGEICLLYLSNNHIKNIIVITFTLALILVVTVDINNAIDENKHFMSAYNVSIGNLDYSNHPKMDKRFLELGTRIKYTDISSLFKNDFKQELTEDIDKENKAISPADYGTITYIPSALGILIARTLSSDMADIYYAGRLFNLLTFMGLVILAFKLLPYKKNTFFVVLTMPMLLLMSTVYSADMLAIAFSTVFIAYCLKLYEKDKINIKDVILLIVAVRIIMYS